uniref:hypothetical protein n=1 Tax=uncultured Reyranella sp. TaxID=735512 RepID=UPI00259C8DC4
MTADLDRLVADLDQVPAKVHIAMVAETTAATKRAETQARRNASGRRSLPGYPSSITSEVKVGLNDVTGAVGPEKGGQGSLGHIIEHGSPTSGAHMDVHQAVDG